MSEPKPVQLPKEMWLVAAQLTQAWAILQTHEPGYYASDTERVVFDVFARFAASIANERVELR